MNRSTIQQLSIYVFTLALFALNGWLLNSKFQHLEKMHNDVARSMQASLALEELLTSVRGVQMSTLGYLLTDDEAYIRLQEKGIQQSHNNFQIALSLIPETSRRDAALVKFEGTMNERFSMMKDILKAPRAERAILEKQHGIAMGVLRDQLNEIRESQSVVVEQNKLEVAKAEREFQWILIFSTLLAFLVVTLALLQYRRSHSISARIAKEKADEAWLRDMMAKAAKSVTGEASVEKISQNLLLHLSESLNVAAARIFLNVDGRLKLASEIGVKSSNSQELAEEDHTRGLVEQGFQRKEIWKIGSVPSDYWKIGSSLGERVPEEIVFVPFSFQDERIGVLELGLFSSLSENEEKLLREMREVIGIGLNAAKSRSDLQIYLEKTQQQAEELQAQQEELRTNNEELEQQARALESHQQTLAIRNRELELSKREIESKAIDLQKSNHYKSEFLAKMSHELRTPLNGLLILSTLLMENKEGNLTVQQTRFAESIKNAGNDLLLLINDILDLSKIEARKLQVRAEEFTIENLMQSKTDNFVMQAKSKGLRFDVKIDDALRGQTLRTDRQRLEQILRNFISNALKFTENGSITLEARELSDRMIEFKVTDTGIGIPKDKRNKIFEAFEQADGSVSRKFGGTGLGLTISRELASLLGGEVDLESSEGLGSTFYLRIPKVLQIDTGLHNASQGFEGDAKLTRDLRDAVSTDQQRSISKQLQGLNPANKTILIVEDDDKFRQSITEVVGTYGFQPIEATTAEEALNVLEEHTPSAILLDIKLPGMSGLGFLEMIKRTPHMRHVPVHMISALDFQHNALRMGAMGYLTKPVTIEKVRSALERIERVMSQKVRKVLLIEDDQIQNQAISHLISGSDVQVLAAKSGREALRMLEDATFDCIILDLALPDVSGFDVLSELSELQKSLPPIVIYTGKDLSAEEEEHLRKYSESIIIKGARSPARLLDEVNLFLHRMETLLPAEKQQILSHGRTQEDIFDNKTVLVVDDDLRNVFALTSALESKGLNVRIAKNGIEALETIDKHADIDLVLMDIMMPKMDGFEAITQIRRSTTERVRNLPIIALTAKAMREDQEKCIEVGATDYLAKPVNLTNLVTLLKVWLNPKDIF